MPDGQPFPQYLQSQNAEGRKLIDEDDITYASNFYLRALHFEALMIERRHVAGHAVVEQPRQCDEAAELSPRAHAFD